MISRHAIFGDQSEPFFLTDTCLKSSCSSTRAGTVCIAEESDMKDKAAAEWGFSQSLIIQVIGVRSRSRDSECNWRNTTTRIVFWRVTSRRTCSCVRGWNGVPKQRDSCVGRVWGNMDGDTHWGWRMLLFLSKLVIAVFFSSSIHLASCAEAVNVLGSSWFAMVHPLHASMW
jgi:hypothetical protein